MGPMVIRQGALAVLLAVLFALSTTGCAGLTLTRVDRNTRFDRTSPDAIVVLAFRDNVDVWLAAGIDDGVTWPCGPGRLWHLRSENGFVVARLPPRTGKNKYAIGKIGDGILSKYRPLANEGIWVFNAEPGKVTYVGAVRVVRSGEDLAIVEDSAVTEKDADEFVTRTFPNIPDHVVSRPMSLIYMGMSCR